MAKVLIVGSTGYIGGYVTEQLAKAGVNTTALVRNLSAPDQQRQTKLAALKALGVQLLEGSLESEPSELAHTVKRFTVIVSALRGHTAEADELKLVEAARLAGSIKRFIPASWGGEYPVSGDRANALIVPALKSFGLGTYPVVDALKKAGIPFTLIVCYAFFGWSLPAHGEFIVPGTPSPAEATIFGDGNTPGLTTAEQDIGRVVAKALSDDRTANKKLIIRGQARTQNELLAAYEAATGKKLTRTTVTREQLEHHLKDAQGFDAFMTALHIAIWFDDVGSIPPEYYKNFDHVDAAQMYPDLKYMTVEEFYRSTA